MANTTFSGPIRSESTIKTISKDATSGTITEVTTLGGAPVSLSDGNVTLTNATHSGRVLLVPDGSQDNTYTLPAPIAGSMFRFVYAGGAADATDDFVLVYKLTSPYTVTTSPPTIDIAFGTLGSIGAQEVSTSRGSGTPSSNDGMCSFYIAGVKVEITIK